MKRTLLIIILFVFIRQLSNAQCTVAVSATLTPAGFLACSPITINVGASLYVNGTVSLSGNTSMTVINNGSLTIGGSFSASGNTSFNLSGAGTMQVTGNLNLSGNVSIADGGSMDIGGNASFSGSSVASGTGSIAVAGTSTASGSTNIFGWTGGTCINCNLNTINPTPISLLEFTAVPNNSKVSFNWSTATEINNNYFTIERSSDGQKFTEIITLPSKASKGNSTIKLDYQTTDASPLSGTSYYRLKQTDYNGAFEYFKAVSITFMQNKSITFHVYPNPNQGQFIVDITGIENNHEVQILLHDVFGKLVYANSFYAQESSSSVTIIPELKICKGIYFCSLIVEGIKHAFKVVVE